ncbi:MAG: amidase [Gemmatimonadales bacterium]
MGSSPEDLAADAPESRSRRDLLALLGYGALASMVTGCRPARPDAGALHYQRLSDVAALLRRKEISPVELTRAMLDRITTLDGRLHAYAIVMPDHAMAAARRAESEIQAGRYRGPLHGVPVAVKDLCYTRGTPTRGGLAVLRDFIPTYDATVVTRLETAGAVLLGKLNTTEGAMVGYHRDFEIPVNPWGERLWTGVSSSGSGVATAAGLCFAALGTDTGGSIRFPSMANGIVGLKPTYGRVSRYGVLPLAASLDHVGPMTRSVADAAIVLEAIAGRDENDPTSLEAPVPRMLPDAGRSLAGVRIGFDRAYALDGVDPGLAAAVEAAVRELTRLGAAVVEVRIPDLAAALAAWPVLCAAEAVEAHRDTWPARADEYGAYFREFLEMGQQVTPAALASAQSARAEFSERFREVFAEVDAVVSPGPGVPFEVEPGLQYGSMTEWNQASARRNQAAGPTKPYTAFTFPHDLAGTPALALPCGATEAGLPYTMQLAAAALGEPMLCRIGQAYEEATPWHTRHPPSL